MKVAYKDDYITVLCKMAGLITVWRVEESFNALSRPFKRP